MNVVRLLILITGFGFGFGVDQVMDLNDAENNQEYEYSNYGFCHGNVDFIEHMLDNLSESDQLLVQSKIDEMLFEKNVTLDDLYNDFELRHDFMIELFDFMSENELSTFEEEGSVWHGMGRHRTFR